MATAYDVVVLGTGPAGGIAVRQCKAGGLNCAVVDNRPFGGTCPLRGCEPKKVLSEAADVIHRMHDMRGNGLRGDISIHWPELKQFKDSFVDPVPEAVEKSFKNHGIATYHGTARFTGPKEITVDGEVLTADKIIICTGAEPRPLNFPGANLVLSSDDFFDLVQLPKRIVFLGGGFVSFEFAHAAAAAGAECVIIHRSKQALKQFDPDLVAELLKSFRDFGIPVHTDSPVKAVEKHGDAYTVITETGPYEVDCVVHGAGRIPAISDLDLQAGEVRGDSNGIKVNAYMQSLSNPDVYAAGDCAEPAPALTPTAAMQAKAAAHNVLYGNSIEANHTGTPYALFTSPPMASVGLTEEEARNHYPKLEKFQGDMAKWADYRRIGQTRAGYKILVDGDTKRFLGAHFLGRRAEEIVNIFALAIQNDLRLEDLQSMIWAYPSHGYTLNYMLR